MKILVTVGVLALWLPSPAEAQEDNTSIPSPSGPVTSQPKLSAPSAGVAGASAQGGYELDQKSPAQFSAGVAELLKLVRAGISRDVMKAYIENTQIAGPLSAADIVALKEHGVPDDLTVALVKRGAELASRGAGGSNEAPSRVTGTVSLEALVAALRNGQVSTGYLDPEGYDYFRYYYLYPRTLASANRRLFSAYHSLPSSSIGFWSPRTFRPHPFAR